MTNGAWFVMFPKDRTPSEEGVKAALDKIRSSKVTKIEDMEFTVAIGKTSFDVTLNDESWVAIETKEIVERNGDLLANRDEVRGYDVRFELLFDHRDMGDLFGHLFSAAEKLAKLTNGIIYESDNGVFQ
jgi:hypothetical protein